MGKNSKSVKGVSEGEGEGKGVSVCVSENKEEIVALQALTDSLNSNPGKDYASVEQGVSE
jgi:hypothetical protein